MGWDARSDLLERGFIQADENDSEGFTRGDLVARLDYDVRPPYVVTVRVICKVGIQTYSVNVLSARWLDDALEALDERARAEKLS